MYRLAFDFIERPSAWSPGTAPLHLRALLDCRILSAWLVKCGDRELFAAYREHGLGNLKLLREHVIADLDHQLGAEEQAFVDYLDKRVNLEIDELWQPVNLGSFSKKRIRDMAIEADLKREYDLAYAPFSSVNHAEWPTVRENDTVLCTDALHGGHRVGAFTASPRTLSVSIADKALDYARAGITEVFAALGIDVSSEFAPVDNALRAALYVPDDAAEGKAQDTPYAGA